MIIRDIERIKIIILARQIYVFKFDFKISKSSRGSSFLYTESKVFL